MSRAKVSTAEAAAESPKDCGMRLNRQCIEVSALLRVLTQSLRDREDDLADQVIVLGQAQVMLEQLADELDFAEVKPFHRRPEAA